MKMSAGAKQDFTFHNPLFDNLHNLPWLSNLVLLPAFCNLKLTPCHAFVCVNRGSERKVYLHVLHLSLVLLVSMPRIGQEYSFRFCYRLILTVIKETVNDRKKMGWDWEMTRTRSPPHNMLEHMPYSPGHDFDKILFLTLIMAKLRNRRVKGEWRLGYSPTHLAFPSLWSLIVFARTQAL